MYMCYVLGYALSRGIRVVALILKGFIGPTSREEKIRRACAQLLSDPTRRWRLSELAAVAGFERTHFSRIFRETVGMSFSAWDRQLRVELAKRLLADTDWPIKTIAQAVGYGDVTTFERNFRKIEPVAPKAYRDNRSRSLPITAAAGGADEAAIHRWPSFRVTISASPAAELGDIGWTAAVHADDISNN
jgi:AraC-like DNA-binding protein